MKITKSKQETYNFALDFAKSLEGGEIIGLIGDLGSGKTVFTKGLARGLGISQNITSPTFVLMRLYEIMQSGEDKKSVIKIKMLCHIDAYRAKDELDIISIGAEDYMGQGDIITVIEWADRIKGILPQRTKFIHFEIESGNKRIIKY